MNMINSVEHKEAIKILGPGFYTLKTGMLIENGDSIFNSVAGSF